MLPRVSWSHHIPPNWHLGTQFKLQHIFWHIEKYLLHLLELCFKSRIIYYTYDSYPFCHKHQLKLLDANGKNTDVISLIYDLYSFLFRYSLTTPRIQYLKLSITRTELLTLTHRSTCSTYT